MNILVLTKFYMEDEIMAKVSKIDAFMLAIEAAENGDSKTSDAISKIIQRSIKKERSNMFSPTIEVVGQKEEKYFKKVLGDSDN